MIKSIADIFLDNGSNDKDNLLMYFLNKIPITTGTVTIKNIFKAISKIDIEISEEVRSKKFNEIKITKGIVKTDRRLIKAVRETDKATSPLTKEVIILDVAPPGAAAINITPIESSGDRGHIRTRTNATIGSTIIWVTAPIEKLLGFLIILIKSSDVKPRPSENIIKARANGKKISEIKPINYNNIKF